MATFLRLLISGLFYRAAAASTGLTRTLVAAATWTDPVPGRRAVLPMLPIVVTGRSEPTDAAQGMPTGIDQDPDGVLRSGRLRSVPPEEEPWTPGASS